MAISLAKQIQKKEAQLKALKDKLPLAIGKTVLNDHKVPVRDAAGQPVTYTSHAKDSKGQKLVRYRKLNSLDEFTNNFMVLGPDASKAVKQFCSKFSVAGQRDFANDLNQINSFNDQQSSTFNNLLQNKSTNNADSDSDNDRDAD